ncbi:vitellogenin Ab [Labeo rohita]|uniref:Vitellogenin Ab n=1 Tax=Labeo rohita TaxID=84645 RepID=A0A498MAX7_LABRO|nr:vitellogenin Ab [Labeo rohita]
MNSRLSALILLLLIPGTATLNRISVTCSQQSICAVKGTEVTLKCFYSNINIKTVFWFSEKQSTNWRKNNEPEDLILDSDYSGRVKHQISSSSSTLTISDVRERDSGEYQLMFIMNDGVKHLSSAAVSLTVTVLEVRMNHASTDLTDGRVELTCDTSCTLTSGVRYYYWIKDGQYFTDTVSPNMFVSISSDAGSFSCSLKDFKHRSSSVCVSQRGCWDVTYTSTRVCALRGDISDLREEHQFAGRVEYVGNKLRIKDLKINTQVTSSPDAVSGRQKVILSCLTKCTLNNKHTYIWYKNGQQVTDGFTKVNKLYLDSVSNEELQQYSCALEVPELAGTQTYVYKYEALLFTGLHQEGLARAGIKINSKVSISAATENTFLLKLSNPQLFEYSGIWPTDSFVATKLTSELAAQLQIPIKFEYTNGVVGKIFAPSVVPTTIINLHRGILNIFQLNLKKTQNIYEVQEDGVQGICETQYLISEDEGNNRTTIIKSRDLTLCHDRIMKDVGLTYTETCTECQKIVDALNHLASKKLGEVHEDVPLKFIQLIQLMRFADVDAIEGIWSQFKTRPNFRKCILDAVPAAGTLAALKFIKKTFLAGELSIPEFTQVLLSMVHMVTANLDTIKMYSDLALSHKVQETPVLHEVSMLGFGTMIARCCSGFIECPVELLKPFHEMVIEATAKADIAKMTLILKVLGNARHPASIKYITKFLPVFGNQIPLFPMRVQVVAILALKAIAKKEPKLVQNVVLQIFVNKDLHPELRMVSWIVLFETKPSMGLVITLAHALQKEPNVQVASLVYSHMKVLTRSTHPEFALIAAASRVAIKILSPKLDKLSFCYSKAFLLDSYEVPLKVGAASSAFMINDAATILPRAVVAKARAYLAGAAADVLEVGIRIDGFQEALLKSPFLNEDRLPRMKQVLKALKTFKALPKKQPLGSIYVKILGQEIAFANVDKAVLDQATQLTTGGYISKLAGEALKAMQNGIAFQYAKPLLVAEVRRIFPSVAGVPMELSLYAAAVAAANLKVQAIITPPLTETISVAHLLKTDVKLTAEVSPSIALQTFVVMGLNTADGPAVEGLELEVQLGPRAAKKLLKEISFPDAETPKVKAVLQKLRDILEETGHQGPSPIVVLKVKCKKVPTVITTYAKSLAEYIPIAAQMTGLAISNEKNTERQIELIILVPTETTMDIIIKTPTMTLSKSNVVLPFALPFEAIQAYPENDVTNIFRNLYVEASSAKCNKVRNTLTTFNHKQYNYEIPLSCYQVLVQDCTSEHKFIVLMKKDDVFEHEDLTIKVADIDVNIYYQKSAVKVKINGTAIPTNISYQHPTGTIRIEQKRQGIALYAPGHGLQEVYYDSDQWMVYVVDWMKGQTCGLCGKADGEIRQEYTTPSGFLTKSSVSFAYSWVLPAESCRDASQCHMRLETVKLENKRTSHITVGFFCLPSNFRLNHSASLSSSYEKTEDLRETAEAHMACHCTEECV